MRENIFEQQAIGRTIIEDAYEKANKVFSASQIDSATFEGIYSKSEIERDQAYVKKMEATFAKETSKEQVELKKLATVFEAIMYEQGELSDWIGGNAYFVRSERYDDISNGVDGVVEIQEEDTSSYLAFSVDVTFSAHLEQKISRIEDEIRSGKSARLKYFESKHQTMRGGSPPMPRFIIGAERQTVIDLADLWLKEKQEMLEKHSVQFQILDEIILQCKAFGVFATQLGQAKIAEQYRDVQTIIEKVLKEKRLDVSDTGERDNVYKSLASSLRDLVRRMLRAQA